VCKTGRNECNAESMESIGIKIKHNYGVKNESKNRQQGTVRREKDSKKPLALKRAIINNGFQI
jgi:hypothetical protein